MTHYAEYYDANGCLDHHATGTPEELAALAQGRDWRMATREELQAISEMLHPDIRGGVAFLKLQDVYTLERLGLKVELEWIGEGVDGDYHADDPEDLPLMRFSVQERVHHEDTDEFEWKDIDDTSYCCQIPATADDPTKRAALEYVMQNLGGPSYKRICERLSWMTPDVVRQA